MQLGIERSRTGSCGDKNQYSSLDSPHIQLRTNNVTTRTHSSEERLEKREEINGELRRKKKEGAPFLLMKSLQQVLYYKWHSSALIDVSAPKFALLWL